MRDLEELAVVERERTEPPTERPTGRGVGGGPRVWRGNGQVGPRTQEARV